MSHLRYLNGKKNKTNTNRSRYLRNDMAQKGSPARLGGCKSFFPPHQTLTNFNSLRVKKQCSCYLAHVFKPCGCRPPTTVTDEAYYGRQPNLPIDIEYVEALSDTYMDCKTYADKLQHRNLG